MSEKVDYPSRNSMEEIICNSVGQLDTEDKKVVLGKLVNKYGLGSIVKSIPNKGSAIVLSEIKDDAVIYDIYDYLKLKKSLK